MKPTNLVHDDFLYLRANEGFSLPILYRGMIVRIRPETVTKLEKSKLCLDAQIQIDKALMRNEILNEEGQEE